MDVPRRSRFAPASIVRRIAALGAVALAAAAIAVGCGSDDEGESGIVGGGGPLAWLPAETWLVVTVDVSAARIDEAVTTLDRLPVWSLAEGFLPASDGAGLRRELLGQVAKEADGDAKVTAKQLETAFGDRAGLAVTSTELENVKGEDRPVVMWMEVDDEAAAVAAVQDLTSGEDKRIEHGSVTLRRAEDEETSWLVRDGLMLVAPSTEHLESLVDVHEGEEPTLADDELGRAVIEAGVGEAIAGVALQTDPMLAAAPRLLRLAADETDDEQAAERARAIAKDLAPVLEAAAVDGLVPDWMAGSLTIDETGLRMRGSWSNPRPIAEPELGARELVERMPADVPVASAVVTDGSMLTRLQAAWREVREEYDLDLREFAVECRPTDRWACSLLAEAAHAALEDEALAEAIEEAGDQSVATVQDLGAMLAAAAPSARAAQRARVTEYVASGEGSFEWSPPPRLVAAALRAGLIVQSGPRGTSMTLRARPGSPLAQALRRMRAEDAQAFATLGFDLRDLLTPRGLSIAAEEVDGLHVFGLPQDAPSKVVPALRGEVDVLGESETYEEVVDAAGAPEQVGAWGYVDLRAYAEAIVGSLASTSPEIRRALPAVRNNLADAPGMVIWTTREQVDGHEVGVAQYVAPILE